MKNFKEMDGDDFFGMVAGAVFFFFAIAIVAAVIFFIGVVAVAIAHGIDTEIVHYKW